MSDHVLNLDELFGKAKPVKVVHDGITYELARPESMTPVQYQEFVNLYNKWQKEHLEKGTDVVKIDQALNDIITVLNPKLAEKNLPLPWKSQVMEFYENETKVPTAGARRTRKKPTGA